LSIVARGERLAEVRDVIATIPRPAEKSSPTAKLRVIALTGAGGVGKSTLIGKILEQVRGRQLSVAVLACDPSSSLTGGALLGDRIRMPARPEDPDVFIRSLAVPSGQQAVAAHLGLMIQLLARFGFDRVIVETVGAGQGDTAIRDVADVVVLLVQPEAGDELQWEKAGVLEIADIVAVNKADLPGAQRVQSELREILNLQAGRNVPVECLCGARNEGVDRLWALIESLP
jgi:LAO/AO transport system ATPase